ncbi:MAG: pilus assembly protein [Alphaproteobacteria bacterium]|nr:pilus assembly protein [Alphaproteobacteria bacterium]
MSLIFPRVRVFNESLKTFAHNRQGGVAVFFAIGALPLIAIIALSLDYSKANTYHEKLQTIVDSASLAGIRGNINRTIEQRQEAVLRSLRGGIATLEPGNAITVTRLVITPINDDIQATVAIQSPYRRLFGSLFNMDRSIIRASSTRKTNRAREAQIRADCHIGSPAKLKVTDCSSLP